MSLEYNQLKGLINLLKDPEQKTLELIAQQINNIDSHSIKTLSQMAAESNDEVLVDNWYHVSRLSLEMTFKEWSRKPELESGMYILARLENPAINIAGCQEKLDNYARRVQENLNFDSSDDEILKSMNQVLFEEENFSGNQIFYYDVQNNFIDSVLEAKSGNPITLSSIYILVARRNNIKIEGVGTPGHFIVKLGEKFVDPFFQGREISKDECQIRAQELGVFWRDEYLLPIDDRAVIARSLRNLIAIYKKNKNYAKSADAAELLNIIQ